MTDVKANQNTMMGTLIPCWWGCKMVQSPGKTVCQFPTILHVPTPTNNPDRSIHPREVKMYVHPKPTRERFIAALVLITKTQKQLRGPTMSEWINKAGYNRIVRSSGRNQLRIQQSGYVSKAPGRTREVSFKRLPTV